MNFGQNLYNWFFIKCTEPHGGNRCYRGVSGLQA